MTDKDLREEEYHELKEQDIKYNKVSSSKFLFYLALAAMASFVVGCSTRLYNERYKGKPDIDVQSSSKYEPEYK